VKKKKKLVKPSNNKTLPRAIDKRKKEKKELRERKNKRK
jgi:hypothetical protein